MRRPLPFGGAFYGGVGSLARVAGIGQAVLIGVGAGLSYATGGWKGLVTFGAGILGGLAGKGLIGAFTGKGSQYQLPYKNKDRFQFEYGQEGGRPLAAEDGSTSNIASDAPNPTKTAIAQSAAGTAVKGYPTNSNQINSAANLLVRTAGVTAGTEVTALGLDVAASGLPMFAGGPLGIIVGSVVVIVGVGLAGFGALTVSEAAGYTNYFWPSQ